MKIVNNKVDYILTVTEETFFALRDYFKDVLDVKNKDNVPKINPADDLETSRAQFFEGNHGSDHELGSEA